MHNDYTTCLRNPTWQIMHCTLIIVIAMRERLDITNTDPSGSLGHFLLGAQMCLHIRMAHRPDPSQLNDRPGS